MQLRLGERRRWAETIFTRAIRSTHFDIALGFLGALRQTPQQYSCEDAHFARLECSERKLRPRTFEPSHRILTREIVRISCIVSLDFAKTYRKNRRICS